jgi:hypothetical protein
MNEMIKTAVAEYVFGLVTTSELVYKIANIESEEGNIVAKQVKKIEESEEYHQLFCEFREKVGRLFQENREIDTIIGYYQVMLENEEED